MQKDFDPKEINNILANLDLSSKSIKSCASQLLIYTESIHQICSIWEQAVKKSKRPAIQLALIYVSHELIVTCDKIGYPQLKDIIKPFILASIEHLKSDTVLEKTKKLFVSWAEKKFFEPAFTHKILMEIVKDRKPKKTQTKDHYREMVKDFDPEEFIEKLRSYDLQIKEKFELEKIEDSDIPQMESVESALQSIKSRREVDELLANVVPCKEKLMKNSELIENRIRIFSNLKASFKIAYIYYQLQKKEVDIVNSAYLSYANKVKESQAILKTFSCGNNDNNDYHQSITHLDDNMAASIDDDYEETQAQDVDYRISSSKKKCDETTILEMNNSGQEFRQDGNNDDMEISDNEEETSPIIIQRNLSSKDVDYRTSGNVPVMIPPPPPPPLQPTLTINNDSLLSSSGNTLNMMQPPPPPPPPLPQEPLLAHNLTDAINLKSQSVPSNMLTIPGLEVANETNNGPFQSEEGDDPGTPIENEDSHNFENRSSFDWLTGQSFDGNQHVIDKGPPPAPPALMMGQQQSQPPQVPPYLGAPLINHDYNNMFNNSSNLIGHYPIQPAADLPQCFNSTMPPVIPSLQDAQNLNLPPPTIHPIQSQRTLGNNSGTFDQHPIDPSPHQHIPQQQNSYYAPMPIPTLNLSQAKPQINQFQPLNHNQNMAPGIRNHLANHHRQNFGYQSQHNQHPQTMFNNVRYQKNFTPRAQKRFY